MKKQLPLLMMIAMLLSTLSYADEFRRKIKNGEDDMTEANGRVGQKGDVLTVGYDTASKKTFSIGMTFRNIQLRKYQNVDSAWVQFSAGGPHNDSINMIITVTSIPAKDFTTDSFSVTSADAIGGTQWYSRRFFQRLARSKFTRTVDLAPLINVVTNSEQWKPGGDMNIVIQAIPDTVWNEDSTVGFRRHAMRTMESWETSTLDAVHWPEFFAYYTPNSVGEPSKEALGAYPNPVKKSLFVEWSQQREGTATIELVGSNGKVIHVSNVQSNVGQNTKNLDVSDITSGVYLLRLTDGDMILRKRIIVE